GWRAVPVDPSGLGAMARSAMPSFRQVFLSAHGPDGRLTGLDLERRAYVVRKRVEAGFAGPSAADGAAVPADEVYFPSLSSRTLVYKGMLTTPQLPELFADLRDPRMESALGLVHSRFSTNTF